MVEWDEVAAAQPRRRRRDALRALRAEAAAQARAHGERLRALGAERVYAVDAASSFSRPGPRLVDGVELLAHLLHPELVEAPAEIAFERPWDPATPVRSRPPQ